MKKCVTCGKLNKPKIPMAKNDEVYNVKRTIAGITQFRKMSKFFFEQRGQRAGWEIVPAKEEEKPEEAEPKKKKIKPIIDEND